MASQKGNPGLVGPIIVIGFGILLLMSNLGMLQWSVWEVVLKLWPILLVAAGLDLLIGRRSALGGLLVALLVLAMLVGGVWWIGGGGSSLDAVGAPVSQALQGARSADVEIRAGAISLRLGGGAADDLLVSGVVAAASSDQVVGEARVENDVLKYLLRTDEGRAAWFPRTGAPASTLNLSGRVPIVLRVKVGAGECDLDLRSVNVTSLEVEAGVGRTVITLPSGQVRLHLNSAIGETIVRIPKGAAARVTSRTAIGLTRLPSGGQRFGQSEYSAGASGERIEVEVTSAIGMVTVEEY